MDKLINDFSFGLFFWQVIILVVLIVLLAKFAWKPIMAALEARESGIADALVSAEIARKELLNLTPDSLERLLFDLENNKPISEISKVLVSDWIDY